MSDIEWDFNARFAIRHSSFVMVCAICQLSFEISYAAEIENTL